MIKRLKYISRSSEPMSPEQMAALSARSNRNNERDGVTGILIEASGLFFQVIEGPPESVDRLYARICADPRHSEILPLQIMWDAPKRLFPDWGMKTVPLGSDNLRSDSIKLLLETTIESHRRVDLLMRGVERVVWSEMVTLRTKAV